MREGFQYFTCTDLFCGAGWMTTGIEQAEINGRKIARVIQAVNHDDVAIASHSANHPHVLHYVEDITKLHEKKLLQTDILYAAPDCTNHSKAKGGKPKNPDSRSLPEHLPRYIKHINPLIVVVENVEEIRKWGAIDRNGKPKKKEQGKDYIRWVQSICALGYEYDHRILDAANYGAYTSRKRYFGIFAKKGIPIRFPQATHSKGGKTPGTLPWNAVKEVLDFEDEGSSIFTRKKPLVEKTLARIYAGLIKYVAGGKDAFMMQLYAVNSQSDGVYDTGETARTITTKDGHALVQTFLSKNYSGHPDSKNISVDGPAGSITTKDSQSVVKAEFISRYYSGNDYKRNHSVDEPAGTVTTNNRLSLVQSKFLSRYNGQSVGSSIDQPAGTLDTNDRLAIVQTHFLDKQYQSDLNHQSVEQPAGTITTNPKLNLVEVEHFIARDYSGGGQTSSVTEPAGALPTVPKISLVSAEKGFVMNTNFSNVGQSLNEPAPTIVASRRHHYLVNPQYESKGSSIENPAFTLIARMDKAPPYLVTAETGELAIVIYDSDSEYTKKIKEFMALYGIVDIKIRMLKILELMRIQGFPANYVLLGNQETQKKHIGNSVEVNQAKVVTECVTECLLEWLLSESTQQTAVA